MRGLVVLLLGTLCLQGTSAVPLSEYKQRRLALRDATGNAVVLLFGAAEGENGELRTGFFQEPNFYYLTGWTEPNAILVLTPDAEVLLIPRRNRVRERWTGVKIGPADPKIAELTGFDTVAPAEGLEARLSRWTETAPRILTSAADQSRVKAFFPFRQVGNVEPEIAQLRMIKSTAEIAAIQRSTDASIDAHLAAWKLLKAGLGEYQVAAAMGAVYFGQGCERHAYAPIVGSGPNGVVLHYSKDSRTIDEGELVLMDVAAECSMYASDLTRTAPANGKFNRRQRELYDIVLGAHDAVIAAIKPGVPLRKGPNSLQEVAVNYFKTHGKNVNDQPLDKYFTHGIGHHVGLDVHDPSDPAAPLAPGMVITVEPGLYIPEEGIGIRIEDVVLVTENGAKVLSSRLPSAPAEIEKAMAKAH